MATRRSGYFKTSYAGDLTLFDTPFRKLAVLSLAIVALLLPTILSQQSLHILNLTMVAIIGAIATIVRFRICKLCCDRIVGRSNATIASESTASLRKGVSNSVRSPA